jgi:hypothetical protein
MHKVVLNVIRLLCLVVVLCFFFSYFVISCGGSESHISGKDAAVGFDMGMGVKSDPNPGLLLIPGVAIVVLILLSVSPKGNETASTGKSAFGKRAVPVVGSIIGLIVLAVAYNASVGEVRGQAGGQDISSVFRTGIGFRTSVAAYIIMLVLPVVEMLAGSKTGSKQGTIAGQSVDAPPSVPDAPAAAPDPEENG